MAGDDNANDAQAHYRPPQPNPALNSARPITIATKTQFLTARAVARRMIEHGSGVILTITGGPARRAFPNLGGFDTACAAIEGLWRTFAAELALYGIRLVIVGSAGSPDTPMSRKRSSFMLGQRANLLKQSSPIRAAIPCWVGCRGLPR